MIKKIKGKYFAYSIKEVMLVERELKKPLPVEILDNQMFFREPNCCICGGDERHDVAIVAVDGDREKRICNSCAKKDMPDLWPKLEKRIHERNVELGIPEAGPIEENKEPSPS